MGADSKDADLKISWWQFVKDLLQLTGVHKLRFLMFCVALFVIYLYNLVPAIFLAGVIDFLSKYQAGQDYSFVVNIALLMGVLHLVMSLIRLRTRHKSYELFNQIVYEVKTTAFNNLVDYSLTWHEEENTGNKVQRIQTGTAALQKFASMLNSGSGGIAQSISAFFGVFVSFVFLSPFAFLFAAIFMMVFLSIHLFFARKTAEISAQRNAQLETASGNLVEGLNNMLTIKSLGAKDSFQTKIVDSEKLTRDYENKLRAIYIRKRYFFHGVLSVSFSLFLILLIQQNVNAIISLGALGMYYNYFGKLVESTWDFTDVIDDLQQIKLSIARFMPIFRNAVAANTGRKFPRDWQQIEMRGLMFRYTNGKEALQDLNMVVNRNQKVGIVGRSGSGKSTFVKVLLGLYKPESGVYEIGAVDFAKIASAQVSKNISIVLQESELFNDTLLNNITLFQEPDLPRLYRSIEAAQLTELVSKLEDGVQSKIGEKGYKLSGGERQRLGIARALYKNTDIIIFDEATSNLDSTTEAKIQSALDRLENKTMIFVAHRLSTLKNTDNIFVFSEGNVAQSGSFMQLSQSEGIFRELFKAQEIKEGVFTPL